MRTSPERRQPCVPLELHHEIAQFLFLEASLLDDRRFRDWLELMAQDLHYTMRTCVNAQTRDRRDGIEPPTTWIFNDTRDQLERRVARLETGKAWAEEPPSRTRHLVTNIQVHARDCLTEFDIRLNYALYRSRRDHDQTTHFGVRHDRVRRDDGSAGFQLCRREIILDQVVLDSHNLSVLF